MLTQREGGLSSTLVAITTFIGDKTIRLLDHLLDTERRTLYVVNDPDLTAQCDDVSIVVDEL